jgi:crossover junction endodeoxyribonuclease RuvC
VSGLRVLGIDQSLTSSGLALYEPDNGTVTLARVQPKARGHERLALILAQVNDWATACDLVAIEGLSFGARGSALLELAGLQHLIRHELWSRGIPYVIIDPATRAKYITGSGAAPKDDCLVAAVRRFPDLPIAGNDQADALVLLAMACDYYGQPLTRMPADRTALLRAVRTEKNRKGQPKIAWPVIERKTASWPHQ